MNGDYALVRFQADRGKSWTRCGNGFRLLNENGPLPQGPNEVVPLPAKDNTYRLLRLNLRTGQVWHMSNYKCVSFYDSEEAISK